MPTLTDSILAKWREQGSFIRFKDGDTKNCRADNLEWVSIKDAMDNFHTWTTDWDMNLTRREKRVVETTNWRMGLRF